MCFLTNSQARIAVHGLNNLSALLKSSRHHSVKRQRIKRSHWKTKCLEYKCEYKLDLIEDHPVGVYLSVPLGVQHHRLEGSEVCQGDFCVLWAVIIFIHEGIVVKIILTQIANPIPYKNQRAEVKVGHKSVTHLCNTIQSNFFLYENIFLQDLHLKIVLDEVS